MVQKYKKKSRSCLCSWSVVDSEVLLQASGKANRSSSKTNNKMRPQTLTEPWVLLTFCMPKALTASLMERSERFRHKVTKSDSTLLSLCGSMLPAFEGSTSESLPEQPMWQKTLQSETVCIHFYSTFFPSWRKDIHMTEWFSPDTLIFSGISEFIVIWQRLYYCE